ncbi:MAG: SPASM domain-containing protein [Aphanocapsa lilacina HA4352-LM1]|jgi:uncharacterized protein|nr:SPASM domain-containing protein [Aphanocapsa lilacina HA4352-LM1]
MQQSRYNIWVESGEIYYVFNTLSGRLVRLTVEERQAVDNFVVHGSCESNFSVLQKLVENRMLIASEQNELAVLEQRFLSGRNARNTFALTIVTSLGCNYDCLYCYELKQPSLIGAEVVNSLLELIDKKLPEIESFKVSWLGGEPLLGKSKLLALSDRFIERCDRFRVTYAADLTTNGSLLDEQTCAELRARRVLSAQVSLDGPALIHDRRRPLKNGDPTFWKILQNLHHAVNYLNISIRVNVDSDNVSGAEQLLQILQAEGLENKLSVHLAQVVAVNDGAATPSSTYRSRCLNSIEFAKVQLEFVKLASRYGFGDPLLPKPIGTGCTAVRAHELVVGSKGELYKCWNSIGNPLEVVGHISNYQDCNGRLQKWLKYDPFSDEECRNCVALPVCMGGCARHAMDPVQHDNRCDTFRHNYRERILAYIEAQEKKAVSL